MRLALAKGGTSSRYVIEMRFSRGRFGSFQASVTNDSLCFGNGDFGENVALFKWGQEGRRG